MYVKDKRKWLRAKRWLTLVSVIATLASIGGLEGTQPVPAYSWVLLAITGYLVVNITRDFEKQYNNRR
jgi:hypothetical protein